MPDNTERYREFHNKLIDLINEYPELTASQHFGDHICEDCEDDLNAPKMLEGHVLLLGYQNLDGSGQMVWSSPPDQHYYTTVGMLTKVYEHI